MLWEKRLSKIAVSLAAAALVCGLAGCKSFLHDDKSATYRDYVVVAANPYAAKAGAKIIARGGSAVDAAIATEAVLGLVEPQSSGLGGGGLMMLYDNASKSITSFDGRETAPAASKPDQFLDEKGVPKPFFDQVLGGKSVGVPGLVPMLAMAHKAHGKLPWTDLFADAIELADKGFIVSPRMHAKIALVPTTLKLQQGARDYFFDSNGAPIAAGTRLRNPGYAATLRAIALDPAAMSKGTIVADIIKAAAEAPKNPQALVPSDFANYHPRERAPVCGAYHRYRVCSMGPPSSGGIAVLQTLAMLERFDIAHLGAKSAQSWHLITEAEKLAFADRAQYLGDPDFVHVPIAALLDRTYLASRAALIDEHRASTTPRAPGILPNSTSCNCAPNAAQEAAGTSHFVIADRQGNVVSMTATVESVFGSQLLADGFILNNELTDFSPVPTHDGKPVANALAVGKRPLSSMSPTIVMDENGRVVMAVGSAGGKRIIGFVVKTIIGALDWNMHTADAIDLPNVLNTNGPTEIEAGPAAKWLAPQLEAMGHTIRIMEGEESGLHAFHHTQDGFEGGADSRREGYVAGDER